MTEPSPNTMHPSPAEIEQIRQWWRQNRPARWIAHKSGWSVGLVVKHTRDMPRRIIPLKPIDRDAVVRLHHEGVGTNTIALRLGCSRGGVTKIKQDLGLVVRRRKAPAPKRPRLIPYAGQETHAC